MEEEYSVAQYCLNGHPIVTNMKYPNLKSEYCSKCGAATITRCSNCDTSIRGDIKVTSINYATQKPSEMYYHKQRPNYCHKCGKPYPWTEQALEAAKMLINDDESFNQTVKDNLTEVLPDIIAETPKSTLAATRFGKAIKSAGKFTAEGLRQFIIDFGCELILKQMKL